MFERFTEKARRVIFFARYEASHYGSPHIETEHLLLGLLREDGGMVLRCVRPNCRAADFRTQIETQITRGERISTSVEMPLTQECKQILNRAKEESDRLGHRYIGTEHLLLGIFVSEISFAARLLLERGAKLEAIREQLAKTAGPVNQRVMAPLSEAESVSRRLGAAEATVESFLDALKSSNTERLATFFAVNSQFVDSAGKRWIGRPEIEKQFETLVAPYAKKNVACRVEESHAGPSGTVVVSVLWENVTVPCQSPRAMHRMTMALAPDADDWAVYLLQVTPILTR